MSVKYINLNNRAIIYIKGEDRKEFLQGLITNDVNKIAKNSAIYALMLNPQGRFLYDFFVIENQNQLLLDVAKDKALELVKKLSFYKLRSKVEIGLLPEMSVISVFSNQLDFKDLSILHFIDPRNNQMGLRIIADHQNLSKLIQINNLKGDDLNQYNFQRMKLKIPDDNDLTYDHSLILEYGFDDLNAIDYKKGCYVGQEVTARTHYRGLIRKKIYFLEIENLKEINKQSEITCDGKKAGIILSSLFFNEKLMALGLIKNIDNSDQEIDLKASDLRIENHKVNLID